MDLSALARPLALICLGLLAAATVAVSLTRNEASGEHPALTLAPLLLLPGLVLLAMRLLAFPTALLQAHEPL